MADIAHKPCKSVKVWWGSIGDGDILKVLFGDREETVRVAGLMIRKMKENQTLSMTRGQMRHFAKDLDSGELGVKYSYHNFYTKLVRKLVDLGFLEKGMVWNPKRRTTIHAYQLKLQSITERPPQSGFVKQAWQVAKGWNDLIQSQP